MSDKNLVLELVQNLPEESTLEQISKKIAFLAGLRAAEEQADRGDLIDHDRIREELETYKMGRGIYPAGPSPRST